jgi:hypothetical protein
MLRKLRGWIAASILAAPLSAQALSFSFDDADQLVARPAVGSVDVEFFGTLVLDPAESVTSFTLFFPYSALDGPLGVNLAGTIFGAGNARRFSIRVESTSPFGLYQFRQDRITPVALVYAYFDATGAPQSSTFDYSVEVVDGVPVPETGSFGLFAAMIPMLLLVAHRRRLKA